MNGNTNKRISDSPALHSYNLSFIAIVKRFSAVLKLLCPRCLQGEVFCRLWEMNLHCPNCCLEFEREPGYFLGAMYFSYGLAIVTGAPTTAILIFLGVFDGWIILVLAIQLGLSSPLLYRYSRVMWLHMDQVVDPR